MCVICRVYVPRGELNAQQHLGGKKHANQARTVTRQQFLTRKAAFEREHPAAAQAAKLARLRAPDGKVGVSQSPFAVSTAAASAAAAVAQLPPVENLAAMPPPVPVVDLLATAREDRIAALREVEIDTEGFMSSILDSDDGGDEGGTDGEESEGDAAMDELADVAEADGRRGSFGPMKYAAPPGLPDIFEDTTARTDKSETLRDILGPAGSNARSVAPATGIDAALGGKETVDFVALERPQLRDEENAVAEESAVDDDDAPAGVEKSNGIGIGDVGKCAEEEGEPELPPWLVADDAIDAVKYSADGEIALHYEILQFERFMSPTRSEVAVRRRLVQTVVSIVNALWPAARVDVFGSYATNLYLPTSDIDVCVMNTPLGGGEAPTYSELSELAQAIRNVPQMAKRVNFIKARVPLVKIVARESNVQCDISFNRSNGIANVAVIKRYIADYPALRPLLLVIKCYLQQRSLNEVFSGGLGSYTVLLMVVSHLQNSNNNFPGAKANLGTALKNFFKLYGRVFNYVLAGVRVKNGGSYFDKVGKYHTPPLETLRFSIEDPNDETNELGRSSYAASRIRKAFGNSFMFIANWKRDDPTAVPTPLLGLLHVEDLLRDRRSAIIQDLTSRDALSMFTGIEWKAKQVARAKVETPDLPVDLTGGTNDDLIQQQQSYGNGMAASNGAQNGNRGMGYQASREPAAKRRRAGESGYGQQQPGFANGGGFGSDVYAQQAQQAQQQQQQMGMGGMSGGMYDPMAPQPHQQVPMDAFSGYGAPDPRQLSQMQGLQQYPVGGGAGGAGAGVWDGVIQNQQQQSALQNQQQQAMQYQQQQYDPVYAQQMQGSYSAGMSRGNHAGRGGMRGNGRGGGGGGGRGRGRGGGGGGRGFIRGGPVRGGGRGGRR